MDCCSNQIKNAFLSVHVKLKETANIAPLSNTKQRGFNLFAVIMPIGDFSVPTRARLTPSTWKVNGNCSCGGVMLSSKSSSANLT